MHTETKLIILDRVKMIAENFNDLTLVEIVTLFVATATLFENTQDIFYESYLKVMQQTVTAKELGRDPHDVIRLLHDTI